MYELYTQFDSVFFEKTRLSIITILFQEESMTFNGLKERLGATDGALYTHLEKLGDRGYVTKRREFTGVTTQTVYTLSAAGIGEFERYVAFLTRLVTDTEESSK